LQLERKKELRNRQRPAKYEIIGTS
jgi:hypothetical protein